MQKGVTLRKYAFSSAILMAFMIVAPLPSSAAERLIADGGMLFQKSDGSIWLFEDQISLRNPLNIKGISNAIQLERHIITSRKALVYYNIALIKDGSVWEWEDRCKSPSEKFMRKPSVLA